MKPDCRGSLRCTIAVAIVLLAVPGAQPAEAQADPTTTPGLSRVYSTIYSIGIEWDILGDADHDASATVMYRVAGTSTWDAALPLVRVDGNGSNMFSGSIFFLTPATQYEVSVALSDPDGGGATRTLTIVTRPLPALPATEERHDHPGSLIVRSAEIAPASSPPAE